jgi:hypothetical protein
MGWGGSRRTEMQAGTECPDCLRYQVHTPVERWKGIEMKYCTFHYWMMKGREGGVFTLEAYVELSRYFGFIISLPSPEVIGKMMGREEIPVIGPMVILQELASSPRGR